MVFVMTMVLVSIQLHGQTRVLDVTDSLPIAKATVIDASGRVVGMTDSRGHLPKNVVLKKNFSIRHIAYQTLMVEQLLQNDSLLFMTPAMFGLSEVKVTSAKLEYLYLRSFFRLYQQRDSVLEFYREGYLDSFLKLKKNSGKEKIVRQGTWCDKNIDLSNQKNILHDMVCLVIMEPSLVGKPIVQYLRKKELEQNEDTLVYRKRNGNEAGFIHVNHEAGITIAQRDYIAFQKDHSYNLWGLKILGLRDFEITCNEGMEVYTSIGEDVDYKSLQSYIDKMEVNIRTKKRGKYKVYCFLESYVVDRRLLTKEQMKQMWNKPEPVDEDLKKEFVPQMGKVYEEKIKEMVRFRPKISK